MIRPDEGKSGPPDLREGPTQEAAARDFWVYVQDERLRHPRLWRLLIRVHTRAFHLAYPDLSLGDVWTLADVVLQDAVAAIQNLGGNKAELDRFHLQVPIFPAENQASVFEGRWRGWMSIGKPELVY